MSIKHIITDIEGTTTDIAFVHDCLFPFARARIPAYVSQHAESEAMSTLFENIRALTGIAPESSVETYIQQLLAWMDKDEKITPLKQLQGDIWQAGYYSGELKGHLYPDAAQRIKAWHQDGYKVHIYSSGSVAAQKLLFGNSEYGDLTGFLGHYFDTQIGPKKLAASYDAITKVLDTSSDSILFLSDSIEELNAANETGMATIQLIRSPITAEEQPLVSSSKSSTAHLTAGNFNDVNDWLNRSD